MDVLYKFDFHDQLPTTDIVVSVILSFPPGGSPLEGIETNLTRKLVHSISVQLIELWQKGFTAQHIPSISSVKKNVRRELQG